MVQTTFFEKYKYILWTAILLRIIAILFSPGYGMHDDHFLVIEASGSWVEGYDYNKWLPWNPLNNGPEGHSFTYVGLNFIFFYLLKIVGIVEPKIMMLLVRVVHATFSLITVVYGIKITEKLSNQRASNIVGWLLAALWIFPFLSVRQLFEFTPVPFVMLGIWFLIKDKERFSNFLIAGILFGIAASFRYQIGVFAVGVAMVYFFQFLWKPFLLFCSGVLLAFCFTQGVVDFFIWGYPFAEMIGYVTYNMNEGTQYLPNTNYFMYFYVLVGSLFVPLGILIMIGFFNVKKENLILFVPTLLFLLFHTWYPNRQERFILTILPVFIILGVIGFQQIKKQVENGFDLKIWRYSWIIFWVFNIPFLLFASTMYSKKSRVEAMYSIYENPSVPKNVLMEGSGSNKTSLMPRFYSKDWEGIYVDRVETTQSLNVIEGVEYDYIFFFDEEKLEQRINSYKEIYPKMELHKKCYPSTLDVMLRKLNPRNANEYIEVWKTNRNKS